MCRDRRDFPQKLDLPQLSRTSTERSLKSQLTPLGSSFQRRGEANFQRQDGWQNKAILLLRLRRASIIFRVATAATTKLDRNIQPGLEPQCRNWVNWADT